MRHELQVQRRLEEERGAGILSEVHCSGTLQTLKMGSGSVVVSPVAREHVRARISCPWIVGWVRFVHVCQTLYASMHVMSMVMSQFRCCCGCTCLAGVLPAGTELPPGVVGQVPCSDGMPGSQGRARVKDLISQCNAPWF